MKRPSGFIITNTQDQLKFTKTRGLRLWSSAVIYSDVLFLIEDHEQQKITSVRNPLWIVAGDFFSALCACRSLNNKSTKLFVHVRDKQHKNNCINLDVVEEVIGTNENHPIFVKLESGLRFMLGKSIGNQQDKTAKILYPIT